MIREVSTRREMAEFVGLPRRVYMDDPHWAPPLWIEERTAYTAAANPILKNAHFALLLAYRDGRAVGRNLVYVDHAYNRHTSDNIGFFGAFEAINDARVGAELHDYATRWLAARGVRAMRGPIHPIAESWGFLLDGYGKDPVFMAPYTPPYYLAMAEAAGLRKVKDLLAYVADGGAGYTLPERVRRFSDTYRVRHPEITVRPIDPRRLVDEAEHIRVITNTALAENWGYVPAEREVMLDMVKKLKLVIDPDAIWFACDRGRPVGYAFGFPDVNDLLRPIRGRLLPFGFVSLLARRRQLRRYRLFGIGVLPAYQGRGLDALLYRVLHDALRPRGIRLEANYILEDNLRIRVALEKLGMVLDKRYRVYEKPLR